MWSNRKHSLEKNGLDPLTLAGINLEFGVVKALLVHGADPIPTTAIDKITGQLEMRNTRLSEYAIEEGHQPGVEGMLAVVKMVFENFRASIDREGLQKEGGVEDEVLKSEFEKRFSLNIHRFRDEL